MYKSKVHVPTACTGDDTVQRATITRILAELGQPYEVVADDLDLTRPIFCLYNSIFDGVSISSLLNYRNIAISLVATMALAYFAFR